MQGSESVMGERLVGRGSGARLDRHRARKALYT